MIANIIRGEDMHHNLLPKMKRAWPKIETNPAMAMLFILIYLFISPTKKKHELIKHSVKLMEGG